MSCTICGGDKRRPIAPSYWECRTEHAHDVPGPGQLDLRLGPVWLAERRICGNRYHEGPPVNVSGPSLCACKTFAIGVCGDCGEPVCGDCSALDSGQRVHCTHIEDRRAQKVVEVLRSVARATRDESAELAEAKDAVARFCQMMAPHGYPGTSGFYIQPAEGEGQLSWAERRRAVKALDADHAQRVSGTSLSLPCAYKEWQADLARRRAGNKPTHQGWVVDIIQVLKQPALLADQPYSVPSHLILCTSEELRSCDDLEYAVLGPAYDKPNWRAVATRVKEIAAAHGLPPP